MVANPTVSTGGGCTRPPCPSGSCCGVYRPQFSSYNPCSSCYGGSRCGGCYR